MEWVMRANDNRRRTVVSIKNYISYQSRTKFGKGRCELGTGGKRTMLRGLMTSVPGDNLTGKFDKVMDHY